MVKIRDFQNDTWINALNLDSNFHTTLVFVKIKLIMLSNSAGPIIIIIIH